MPTFDIEHSLNLTGAVFGLDEAGRGPWCGPVVAAAVYWPQFKIDADLAKRIDDSKKLSAVKREALFRQITESNAVWGIGLASAQEIDSLNILQASFLAMERALQEAEKTFHIQPAFALIDGNRLPKWTLPARAVIKGDSLSLSIAAASILAKVTRDRLLTELGKDYPQYGWGKNAGYGTKEHIQAIETYGITPHHRRSYAPIKKYLATRSKQ